VAENRRFRGGVSTGGDTCAYQRNTINPENAEDKAHRERREKRKSEGEFLHERGLLYLQTLALLVVPMPNDSTLSRQSMGFIGSDIELNSEAQKRDCERIADGP
jgi:hypothetical protein